jgi:uncharacterized protein YegP (UPF0339 family)
MSSIYRIGLQKARGGYRVVLASYDNGKLVLSGETIKSKDDAWASLSAIHQGWCGKRNTLLCDIMIYPASHKWPKNSGPKKKAVKKLTKKK